MRKKNDDSKPATKGDLKEFRTQTMKEYLKKFATKADLQDIEKRLESSFEKKMVAMKDETIRHFYVVAEDMRHDYLGATKDQIEVLKDHDKDHAQRIVRLEHATGLSLAA